MALGSTQPLTEMSTRNISWGLKVAGAKGCQPYHLHVPTVLKSGRLSFLEPPGPDQACTGIDFTFDSERISCTELLTVIRRDTSHEHHAYPGIKLIFFNKIRVFLVVLINKLGG